MSEIFFENQAQEYVIAGWTGTLNVMKRLGEESIIRAFPSWPDEDDPLEGIPQATKRLCRITYEKPDALYDTINSWLKHSHASGINSLDTIEATVISELGRSLAQEFSDALAIYDDDHIGEYIRNATSFSRLLPTLEELENHYSEITIERVIEGGRDISSELREVRRQMEFYTGHYDPHR